MTVGFRPGTQRFTAMPHPGFPVWCVVLGTAVMVVSLWLLGAGGMSAKLMLLGFWAVVLAGYGRRISISPAGLGAIFLLVGMIMLVASGNGVMIEKLRLIGNLLMLPVGLVAGLVIGRDCLRIMVPALVIYLPLSSAFYLTHEGLRLNHPFLFLGLFALCSAAEGRAGRWIGGGAAIAVLLSQTRIAVLAMMVNAMGLLRLSLAKTWLVGAIVFAGFAGIAWQALPRLLMTHDSGRLFFWHQFADIWLAASDGQKWLGFGAGSVEEILSGFDAFSSFGALHNDHFRILFETGIIGAGLWLSGWAAMVWLVRHSRLSVCLLISVAITMITDNTLNYGHYLICVGMAAGMASNRDRAHG
ncbi:polymerase [Thalassospira lohafexi]|uniref:Polymerase n=1 Tax=Thalassospira lohafexi TaxID=744227 RepID=A0A2N3L6M7_9PROT|nr:polymerase [Thalassospira lohafexi]PKR58347.1 polymerase [Thalassospira lohafexi]